MKTLREAILSETTLSETTLSETTLSETTLKEALFNKKNLDSKINKLTDYIDDNIKGQLIGVPRGLIVRMLEEQYNQYGEYTIEDFYSSLHSGFIFRETEAGVVFWHIVLINKDFDHFFKRYPEYKKYN